MGIEMQSIWESMKGSYYERTIAALENEIEKAGNLNEALSIALNRVVNAAHAVAGSFWFYDRFGDGKIHPRATYGGCDLGDFTLESGEGIAGEVIANSKSTIVPDCQSDPRWAGKADQRTGFKTRTMICVPLHYQQYTFGCIEIINKMDDHLFDNTDLLFVENLAAHTAYLFAAQHMLDGYSEIADTVAAREYPFDEPTFSELFGMEAFADVEETMLKLEKVNTLSETNQKNILRMSREIWKILTTQEPQ